MGTGKGQIHFNKPADEVLRNKPGLTPEQQAAKDRMAAIKSSDRPVGGVPPVKIPPLNSEPISNGGSMSRQAELLRDATSPLSPAYNPDLAKLSNQAPFQTLPPDAVKDPRFVHGVGSMIADNQPQLREPRSVISDKTRVDLETLARLQKEPPPAPAADPIPSQEQSETSRKEEDEILAEAVKQERETRSYGGDEYQWNIHNNPERKKEIEARLKPLDIVDVIQYGEIRQDIVIVPGKMKVTLRSLNGEEDLAIKRMMFTEHGGDRYMLDKYSLMNLACGVVSINNFELPTHLNDKKRFDETLFLKKFETLMRFPAQFLADIGVQYMWFDERVRKLFMTQTDAVKNS